jgi:hypothetical protein
MKYNPNAENIKYNPIAKNIKYKPKNAKNIIFTQHSRTHLRCEGCSGEIQNECPRRIPHQLMEWRLAILPIGCIPERNRLYWAHSLVNRISGAKHWACFWERTW